MAKCKVCTDEVWDSDEVTCSVVCKKRLEAKTSKVMPPKKSEYYAEALVPIQIFASSQKEACRIAGKLTKLLKSKRLAVKSTTDSARLLNNTIKILYVRQVRRVLADEQAQRIRNHQEKV
jgi:hypothetical protein